VRSLRIEIRRMRAEVKVLLLASIIGLEAAHQRAFKIKDRLSGS
jgi:hypothetical protein